MVMYVFLISLVNKHQLRIASGYENDCIYLHDHQKISFIPKLLINQNFVTVNSFSYLYLIKSLVNFTINVNSGTQCKSNFHKTNGEGCGIFDLMAPHLLQPACLR